MPYSGGQPLHVSELELPDHPGSKEVCLKTKTLYFCTRKSKTKQNKKINTHSLLVLL
jgi:hypothetical protein